jgi:ketosteroid isomerase-like protein
MLDKIEIQETISRYHEGASTLDVSRIVATFLPDAIWEVPSLGIRSEGLDGIRKQMTDLVASIEYLVQINAPAIIDIEGDVASARSLIRECAKFQDGGVLMDVVGQFVDRLERTPEGWKFAQRTFNVIGTQVTAAAK